ncbi:solute carrier family 35 member E2-like protein [Dinothrombium tinctorium]|uniref:Solute carrier family 35 member E2-like protein n=1 Tax=Dinothrombium tinctorium TaxID=1965070 RepID=A0A3S3PD08_9ACAR|nr:solute carrier family 35 member E2-like protein [Dinothrombium tinctorium]
MEKAALVEDCRKLQNFTTLFLNKYIVTYQKGDPTLLGSFQLLMCAICGYFHMKVPIGFAPRSNRKANDFRNNVSLSNFTRILVVVGSLRILLGEKTTILVNLSLIPVMIGLALCSAYELSFTLIGFVASFATNISECLQNVYSKRLLSVERYEPPQIQFYTSASSLIIQIPCLIFLIEFPKLFDSLTSDSNLLISFILNGVSFHCQSISEYLLLTHISPVTHSVANTTKRALLIWLSIIVFGNPVTTLSWIGTATVIFGVLIYNKARSLSEDRSDSQNVQNSHDV